MSLRFLWFFLVLLFVFLDRSEGWRRRRRRRCPVTNCEVSYWSSWSSCTAACGWGGTQWRSRSVTRGASCGGSCPYALSQSQGCNRFCYNGGTPQQSWCNCKIGYSGQCCKGVNGGWSSWSSWSACSRDCETGEQARTRSCTNPSPSSGGTPCIGAPRQTQACNTHYCPVNGGWSDWSGWTSCSKSCGTGSQERSRSCTRPTPRYGGKTCQGTAQEKQICNKQPCPIHGGWSSWSVLTACSVTCGSGIEVFTRTCSNPKPQHGGGTCQGSARKTEWCAKNPCSIDGGWSSWSGWNPCSQSCGTGSQERFRSCTRPPPSYGGKTCQGKARQKQLCNKQPCPTNGGWSNWGAWTTCTKSCESGTQTRSRSCSQPSPQNGGETCPGQMKEEQECNTQSCPDLEPPQIDSCPGDIKINSPVKWHKLVLPSVTVRDNVGVDLFTTNIQNGSEVTWGEYNITYTAEDKAGNKALCRFLITIAAIKCPSLPIPLNGIKTGCPNPLSERYSTVCSFSCNDGYRLTGSSRRQCLENETWSGLTSSCQVINCSALAPPANGAVSPSSCLSRSTYGQTCSFSCLTTGYVIEGTSARMCGYDGEWTGYNDTLCRDKKPPSFGNTCPKSMVFHVPKCSATAVVSWNEPIATDNSGHVIISYPAVRPPAKLSLGLFNFHYSSADGEGNTAKCHFSVQVTRILCPVLQHPMYGAITSLSCGVSFGSQAYVSCNKGYRLVGLPVRSCEADGRWSGNTTSCSSIKCPAINAPSNGMISPAQCKNKSGVNYETKCFFMCNVTNGYQLEGPSSVSCLEDGSWSANINKTTCKDIRPPSIQCPSNVTVPTAAGKPYAKVTWQAPIPTDNSNQPLKISGLQPPQLLHAGQTYIRYEVTDSVGLNNSCVFSIDVKDLEPPKIDSCPGDVKIISLVKWHKLLLPAVNVTDNVGVNLFTTNIQNGSNVTWGEYNITYTASDKAGNKALCRFLLTIAESPCEDLSAPLNGAKACETWLAGLICTVHCNKGYGFANFPHPVYYCSPTTGEWFHAKANKGKNPTLPDCSKTATPKGAWLIGQYHYLTDRCGGEQMNAKIAVNFIELLMTTPFGWAGACYGNPECKIENVRVYCGEQTRRKRETGDGKQTAVVSLTVSFELRLPLPSYINASIDINQTSLQISNKVLVSLKENDMTLNVSGVVLQMDPSKPMKIHLARFVCGKGQVQSGSTCVSCPLGYFFNGTSCQACTVDHYQDQEAQTSCITCPSGTTTFGQEASKRLQDCQECVDDSAYSLECRKMASGKNWCKYHHLLTRKKCAKSCGWC